MEKRNIYDRIAQELTGTPASDDSKAIKKWVGKSHSNYQVYKVIRNYFVNQPTEEASVRSFDRLQTRISNSQKSISREIQPQTKTIVWTAWMRYAAILLMATGLGWAGFFVSNQEQESETVAQMEEIHKSNPSGQKTTFELPDGTRVNLNAASELTYIYDTDNNRRIVELSGEAFFNVAKDKAKPFTVISRGITTTALGTSFNVKAFDDDSLVNVLLVTGKVQVDYLSNNASGITLEPGMGVQYNTIGDRLAQRDFDFEKELGWKKGIIFFDNSSFIEVIHKLERWYGVDIQVLNATDLQNWSYSGQFENESLINVLVTISHVESFDYRIKDKTVTIKF